MPTRYQAVRSIRPDQTLKLRAWCSFPSFLRTLISVAFASSPCLRISPAPPSSTVLWALRTARRALSQPRCRCRALPPLNFPGHMLLDHLCASPPPLVHFVGAIAAVVKIGAGGLCDPWGILSRHHQARFWPALAGIRRRAPRVQLIRPQCRCTALPSDHR